MASCLIGRLISNRLLSHTHLPLPIEADIYVHPAAAEAAITVSFQSYFLPAHRSLARAAIFHPPAPLSRSLLPSSAISSPSFSPSLSSTLLSRSYITPALLISPPIIAFCSPVSHYVHSQSPVSGSPLLHISSSKGSFIKSGFLARLDGHSR